MLGEFVMGGIVVGIGLNVVFYFVENIVVVMSKLYGIEFMVDFNKFYGLVYYFGLNVVYGVIKILVVDLMKIVNDVWFLVSGLWVGYDELNILVNEFGLLIMFGKVNLI